MAIKMKIFNVILSSVLCLAPGLSRGDDGECGYFNPAFALCSTHSHNIGYTVDGLPANPDKSEEVSQMNHIIALKTTLMAQQLKEQYDTLSVIIKRFKTQLEKAVLVSKIEVATGNAASGNSGGGSSGSGSGTNKGLASASDCSSLGDYDKIFDCVIGNLQKVKQVATSDTMNAKNQLGIDLGVMDMYNLCIDSGDSYTKCSTHADFKTYCKTGAKNLSGSEIPNCVNWLSAQVSRAKSKYSASRSRGGYSWGP